MKRNLNILSVLLLSAAALGAAPATLTVQVDKPGVKISPMLWGIFFEEINHAGDGGLYAEMARNRSFEDSEKPEHWKLVTRGSAMADMAIDNAKPLNPYNRRSVRVSVAQVENGGVALVNEGFWGMNFVQGESCLLTFAARAEKGYPGEIRAGLESREGKGLSEEYTIKDLTENWQWHKITLTPTASDPKGRLAIRFQCRGTVWLDMVSLFPTRTWKNRPNGLRPELAELLNGLKPSFVRFPGGCWVEGHDLAGSYRWKETIGDPAHRRNQWNLWQYYSTHGLGYLEYLILCEDLGAEPLFVINCGMSHSEVAPMDEMGPMAQDALDAIEYANGPTNSVWGSLRARHGHPAPFNLKYLEIGNENGGPAYHERYALMLQAIKARYPEIHLIANEWGGVPKNSPVEIVDEHYYSSPEFFIQQANKYDAYDRQGPKIYVGEYAVTQNGGQGNLRAAVGEAAFMTGLERNSDVVVMASYAPLFVQVNYRKWSPDLINFDSSRAYGIPSYYVQKMFSENRGDVVLPVKLSFAESADESAKHGQVGLGTWLTQAEYKDVRVTQGGKVLYESDFAKGREGWRAIRGEWRVEEGAYRQTARLENAQSVVGDGAWGDYTYQVKARKLGGAEGFLIMFHVQDAQNWVWWNLGGWGNSQHALERCEGGGKSIMGKAMPGRIEAERWYDARIEVKNQNIKCYLDGQLVHEVSYPKAQPLYATASHDRSTDEVILKVVNASRQKQVTKIQLDGVEKVASQGQAMVLASEKPEDENSLDAPAKVSPASKTIDYAGQQFEHTFPDNSVTILRLKLQ